MIITVNAVDTVFPLFVCCTILCFIDCNPGVFPAVAPMSRTHELLRILDALLVDEGEVVTRWLVFLGWTALAMMGISTWGNILFDILVLFILIEYVMFGIMSEMSSYKPNC